MSAQHGKAARQTLKHDLILIAALLLISLLLFAVFRLLGGSGAWAVVKVDGKEIARYPLSKDGRFELNGGSNILVIEGGTARVVEADCPDKLCVRQGAISRTGEAIVCLPNRLTVTIIGAQSTDIDAIG